MYPFTRLGDDVPGLQAVNGCLDCTEDLKLCHVNEGIISLLCFFSYLHKSNLQHTRFYTNFKKEKREQKKTAFFMIMEQSSIPKHVFYFIFFLKFLAFWFFHPTTFMYFHFINCISSMILKNNIFTFYSPIKTHESDAIQNL